MLRRMQRDVALFRVTACCIHAGVCTALLPAADSRPHVLSSLDHREDELLRGQLRRNDDGEGIAGWRPLAWWSVCVRGVAAARRTPVPMPAL